MAVSPQSQEPWSQNSPPPCHDADDYQGVKMAQVAFLGLGTMGQGMVRTCFKRVTRSRFTTALPNE